MSRRDSGSVEHGNPGSVNPEPGNPEWPGDLWPDEDGQPDPPAGSDPRHSAGPPGAPGWPRSGWPDREPRRRRFHLITLLVIALVAGLVGAAIALAARDLRGPSGNTATPGAQPSYLNPLQPGGGSLPGPASGGTAAIFLIGRVMAVSDTSVTIGGQGQRLTATVTGSTRVTGKVSSISGIKVGDRVSAQITQNGGRATVIAIQDPARSSLGVGTP
jgi:hypothetical protein